MCSISNLCIYCPMFKSCIRDMSCSYLAGEKTEEKNEKNTEYKMVQVHGQHEGSRGAASGEPVQLQIPRLSHRSVNLRRYFQTYPRYVMTPKRESKQQYFMSNYNQMSVFYKYIHIYITKGSLNFRLPPPFAGHDILWIRLKLGPLFIYLLHFQLPLLRCRIYSTKKYPRSVK